MPLKWVRGRNPYVHNAFGALGLGCTATPGAIVQKAQNLIARVRGGGLELRGVTIEEHELGEASTRLREPRTLAEEVLLVHPQAVENKTRRKSIIAELRRATGSLEDDVPVSLRTPLALFWFLPQPDERAATFPEWGAFHLTEANDPADLVLDIVFDC